jgi:hypothetical protein
MMRNKIFIITSTIDYAVDKVIYELKQQGYDTFRFDIDKIFSEISYTFESNNDENRFYLGENNANFFEYSKIDEIHSVWDTGTLPIEEIIDAKIGGIGNAEIINFIKIEYSRFIQSTFALFSSKFWVNDYLKSIASESKLNNLILAQKLGLQIPKTMNL